MARRPKIEEIEQRLVTFARQANGRFSKPLQDTATCPAASHNGGGIRPGPAAAALAATLAVGVIVGVAATPEAPTAAVVPVSSASPSGTIVVPFVTPTPIPTASPTPAPSPSSTPFATLTPAPTSTPATPGPTPSPKPVRQVIVVRVERTITREVIVTRTAVPCSDPGRHIGRPCKGEGR